jgi:hypothetical protein
MEQKALASNEEILKKSLYIDEDLILPPPLLTIRGKTILTENNFITISGLPKSRKTTFMQFFIASILTGNKVMEIESHLNPADLVVLIDTEQSIFDFYKQTKFLKKAIGKNKLPANFSAYLFREYEPHIILKLIEEICINQKPKIIFIDNLTELVMNPNDVIESKNVALFLKKLTAKYNCGIVNLLHLSKGGINTLGHLGAYADRGSQSILKVTIDKATETSTLEADRLRSDAHFEPITIVYSNEEKKYIQTDAPTTKTKAEAFSMDKYTPAEIKGIIEILFENYKVEKYKYSDIVANLKSILNIGINNTKEALTWLQEKNYIVKIEMKYLRVKPQTEIIIKPKKPKKT